MMQWLLLAHDKTQSQLLFFKYAWLLQILDKLQAVPYVTANS